VLLGIWAAFGMVIVPLVKKIHYLLFSPELREKRVRAVTTAVGLSTALLLFIFLVPVPSWTRTEGVVWAPEEALVRAGSGGFVDRVVATPDSAVKKGELLIECVDPLLTAHVQVLVHSLAFGTLKPYVSATGEETLTQAQMEMTVDVMANSLVYWTQDLIARKLMVAGGRIFSMTSSGGRRVWPYYGAVSAAKAALESHMRQLSLELAPLGITANTIRAGVTDTPALRKIPGSDAMKAFSIQRNPYKRLTTPQDVAEAIAAFCAGGTHWMTGNVIGVDGGEDIVG